MLSLGGSMVRWGVSLYMLLSGLKTEATSPLLGTSP